MIWKYHHSENSNSGLTLIYKNSKWDHTKRSYNHVCYIPILCGSLILRRWLIKQQFCLFCYQRLKDQHFRCDQLMENKYRLMTENSIQLHLSTILLIEHFVWMISRGTHKIKRISRVFCNPLQSSHRWIWITCLVI